MKFYIPPQLTRLAAVFAVFILLFLLLRSLLVPDSFGEYGFYRGASLDESQDIEPHYAGQSSCFECHQDIEDLKLMDAHAEIHCETCHGPGMKHVEDGGVSELLKPDTREFCGICHAKNAARQTNAVFQVDLKEHNIDKKCIECHNAHQPWTMEN